MLSEPGNAITQLKQVITQISWGIIPLVALLTVINQVSQGQPISPELAIMIIGSTVALLFSQQPHYVDICLNALLLVMCGIALITPRMDGFVLLVMISLPIAALFAGNIVYGIIFLAFLVKAFLLDTMPGVFWQAPGDDVLFLTTGSMIVALISVLSLLVRLYQYYTTKLMKEAQHASDLLDVSQQMGQILSRYLNPDDLLHHSLALIGTSFQCHYLIVYKVDESDKNLKFLSVYPDTVAPPETIDAFVERCLLADEAILNQNRMTATHELALPLRYGKRTLGVLHVKRDTAFSREEIQTLQLISAQLSVAMRNMQLYDLERQTNNENKRLFMESRTSLREIDKLKRQLTREAWHDYLQTEQRTISGVTLDAQGFRPDEHWTPEMEKARIRRHSITETGQTTRTITIPIELRKEVIGAIEVEIDIATREDEIRDMLTSIAGRLAVSLDNARLFEETQQITTQEQQVSHLVARYQVASSVEDLLKITLQGLSSSLGAENAQIRLGSIPEIAVSSPRLDKLRETGDLMSSPASSNGLDHPVDDNGQTGADA